VAVFGRNSHWALGADRSKRSNSYSTTKNEAIMNISLAKYTLLLCLAVLFSVKVFSLGVIGREEILYAVLIFLVFGVMVMFIDSFVNMAIKLRGRKEQIL
jgi:hypothetical protein